MPVNAGLGRRAGVTLVELMVVISIITVLATLITAAVFSTNIARVNAELRMDLEQLTVGVQNFKTKFNLYPISKIRLRSNMADYLDNGGYTADQLDKDSLSFLSRIFGLKADPAKPTNIDWGSGMTPAPVDATNRGGVELDGDQCLVFFVGGIDNKGFSTNPVNPADTTDTRLGPFYQFKLGRLKLRPGKTFGPSYYDALQQQPILYFASRGKTTGYVPASAPTYQDITIDTMTITPYVSATTPKTTYHNPDSFQLICAGRDGVFGPGGLWTAATADSMAEAGRDDLTNFHKALMGTPE